MKLFSLGLALLAFGLGGCGEVGVKPWERDLLARRDMKINGYLIDSHIDRHLYFSREASSGGSSFSAGGCGCN
jgi:hypothetical protein